MPILHSKLLVERYSFTFQRGGPVNTYFFFTASVLAITAIHYLWARKLGANGGRQTVEASAQTCQ
jgi:hypothetical protein